MSSITFSQASGFITLQDQGRIGFANIAVPTSGAFDQSAHHLGNRLVGNFPGACSIESLRGTFKFSTDTDLVISVTGAAASVQINGREHEMSRAVYVAAHSTVAVKPGSVGLRTYIAIRGSISGDSVMGSNSYDELSQIGTPPIQAGDQFSISNQVAGSISGDYFPNFAVSGQAEIELEAMPAPRWSGFRLASEGVITGAIQIPVDGMPLIFGPDHPTTGGYPVIAVVSRHSLNLLAQSEPGTKVRFRKAR